VVHEWRKAGEQKTSPLFPMLYRAAENPADVGKCLEGRYKVLIHLEK